MITIALTANVVNVLANYVLVFGEDGIPAWGIPGVPGVPAMGLAGPAIGTIIGTLVQVAIPLSIFLGREIAGQTGAGRRGDSTSGRSATCFDSGGRRPCSSATRWPAGRSSPPC